MKPKKNRTQILRIGIFLAMNLLAATMALAADPDGPF